jgi:hypothetical protein
MAQNAPAPAVSTHDSEKPLVLAPLTAEEIKGQTDEGSFKRGRGYFRSGRIFSAVRRESTLRARCHGSSGGPYVVEAMLAKEGQHTRHNPVTFSCNCPRGGFCKHVVALLLTWIDQPEKFAVRPPVDQALAGKSQAELIALIGLMLKEEPDLENLLDVPMPTGGASGGDPDEAAIHRQIVLALRDDEGRLVGYGSRTRYGYGYDYYGGFDDDYDPASRIARKLEPIAALADAHVADEQWRRALIVSACLVEVVTPRLDQYADENSDLSNIVSRADVNLAACLIAQDSLPAEQRLTAEERERLIDALFTIWRAGAENKLPELGEDGPGAIAAHARPEEQQRVSERLCPLLLPPDQENWQRSFHNQNVLRFLSLLKGDAGLSGDALLAAYRDAELWDAAVYLLLERDRLDEAISLASRKLTAADAFIPFLDRLVATGDPGRIEQAIALADDRLWEQEGRSVRDDQALREWLERRYVEFGPPEKALSISLGRFKAAPSKATYYAVEAAAALPGHAENPWPCLRKELIASLRKLDDWYALIEIHLAEGEVDEALKALRKTEKGSNSSTASNGYAWYVPWGTYEVLVADAASTDFPDEAVRLYKHLADHLIASRGRTNYQSAAEYLRRAKGALEKHDRAEEWSTLITGVREQNKSLRALKEELDILGLA